MRYKVEIGVVALAEVRDAFDWLAARAPKGADRWRAGLLLAVDSLEHMPMRCPLAPECDYFGREIRQLLHGKKGRQHRILFEVRGDTVYVLRVRHGARRFLGEG